MTDDDTRDEVIADGLMMDNDATADEDDNALLEEELLWLHEEGGGLLKQDAGLLPAREGRDDAPLEEELPLPYLLLLVDGAVEPVDEEGILLNVGNRDVLESTPSRLLPSSSWFRLDDGEVVLSSTLFISLVLPLASGAEKGLGSKLSNLSMCVKAEAPKPDLAMRFTSC